MIVEVEHHFYGQHIHKSNDHHLEEYHKGLYGLAIVYPLALTFSKLSLLALYWRIFRVTSARRPLLIVAALNIGWMIAAVSAASLLFSYTNEPATDQTLDSCWRLQLYARSRLLGFDDQKPMHCVPGILPVERGIHNCTRLGRSAHACVLHLPHSAIFITEDFHQQYISSRSGVSKL